MKKNKKKSTKFFRLINNSNIKNIIIFIFSLSISLLSVYLMIGTRTIQLEYITFVITFLTSIIYLYNMLGTGGVYPLTLVT